MALLALDPLGFILLGKYFEIKEKVDVTWQCVCFSAPLVLLVNKVLTLTKCVTQIFVDSNVFVNHQYIVIVYLHTCWFL